MHQGILFAAWFRKKEVGVNGLRLNVRVRATVGVRVRDKDLSLVKG